MKPIGPLMRKHRLIERMVIILSNQLKKADESRRVDTNLITVAIDFFRTYADRTHHGKEEDILFRELAKKQLSQKDNKVMRELIEEHVLARKMVTRLFAANALYSQGISASLNDVTDLIKNLVSFYPSHSHIVKEDNSFLTVP